MRKAAFTLARPLVGFLMAFLCFFTNEIYGQQQFDVAITKTTITSAPVKYGVTIPFNFTIYNQGLDTITNVEVIDHYGDGYEFQGGLNADWSEHPTIVNAVTTIFMEKIPPNESRIITLNLIAGPGDSLDDWVNTGEVVSFTDVNGIDRENEDMDSNGNENPNDDPGGLLGSPADNFINGDGTGIPNDGIAATDEDDHDRDSIRIFDLALTKILDPITGYSYGDTLTFNITVYNQGNMMARIIRIRDIIPEGYIYPVAENVANGWSSDPVNPLFTIDSLAPFDNEEISIKLILGTMAFDENGWANYSEILSARDENFANVSALDADSTPASNSDGERSVQQGDPDDNSIGNSPVNPGDEDDHDPAEPVVFDLALIVERFTALSSFNYNTPIEYIYTVQNQGNVDATDIVLRDSLSCGAMFDQNLNPDWSYDPITNIVTRTISALDASTQVQGMLTLIVIPCTIDQETAWTNYMEISSATTIDGVQSVEIDGVFDTDITNDPGGIPLTSTDNDLDGIGIIDEDNHDVELLQVYDLALKKELITPGPYSEGQELDFRIRVYNQGNIVIEDLIIEDFIPEGYGYDPVINAPLGWTNSYSTLVGGIPTVFPDTLNVMEDLFLATEDSVDVFIKLTLEFDGTQISDWYNYAHIWVATDTVGNNRFDDADSNPFTTTALEFAVIPGSPDDNNLTSMGKSVTPQIEEDDHDVANVDFFDLTLTKNLPAVSPTAYDQEVTFDIVVRNEGLQFAHDITIVDYVPCGFEFESGSNMNWTLNGVTGNPEYFYTDTLFSGEEITLPITLRLVECQMVDGDSWRNVAEIKDALDEMDMTGTDQDSTPDDDPGDGPDGEDDINDAQIDIFDLTLTKNPPVVLPTNYNEEVIFNIVVRNEGSQYAHDITVVDYVPCGFEFESGSNMNWILNGVTGNPEYFYTDTLFAGEEVTIPITLRLVECQIVDGDSWRNVAEIKDALDDTDMTGADLDSTPDDDPGDGPDGEDDINDAQVEVFDLTLTKNPPVVPPTTYNEEVTFDIVVRNEGSQFAHDITIVDYVPCGFEFELGSNMNWTLNGVTGNPEYFYTDTLFAGEEVTIPITLRLVECGMVDGDSWRNVAEIKDALDDTDMTGADLDSTPDDDPGDGPDGEDDINDARIDIFDLTLTKNPPIVPPAAYNEEVTFDIVVRNEGSQFAHDITIVDYVPCGFEFESGSNMNWILNGVTGNPEYFYTDTLFAGEEVTIPITLRLVECGMVDGDSWRNVAEIKDALDDTDMTGADLDSTPDDDPGDGPDGEDDINDARIDIFDLTLTKNPPIVPPTAYNEEVTFDIVVRNEGSQFAHDITIVDYVPCGFEFESGSNMNWILNGVTGNPEYFYTDTLFAGEEVTIPITLRLVECGMVDGDSWRNVAEIKDALDDTDMTGADLDSTPDDDPGDGPDGEDDINDARIDIFDLTLTKNPPIVPPTAYNEEVTFDIVVRNEGSQFAHDITIVDYVPCGFEFESGSNMNWILNGVTGNPEYFYTDTLFAGEEVIIPITLRLVECGMVDGDSWRNIAEIKDALDDTDMTGADQDSTPDDDSGDGPDGEDDINDARIDIFDLTLTKNPPIVPPTAYNEEVTFDIVVRNEGSQFAHDITIVDYIPCGFEFESGSNMNWILNGATGNPEYFYTDTLFAGEEVTIPITLRLVECGMVDGDSWRNVAEIKDALDDTDMTGADLDSTPDDDPGDAPDGEDDINDALIEVFDLSLTKIVTPPSIIYASGDPVMYQIEITNEGNVPTLNSVITDYIPCGLDFDPLGNMGWSVDVSTGYLEYTINTTINPGNSIVIPLTLTVGTCGSDDLDVTNISEISDDGDETGGPVDDFDSRPNNNPNDDPDGEDDIDDIEIIVEIGGSIGDFVFNDLDGDGIQDGGEPGIANVMVILYDISDNVVAVTETNAVGFYEFTEIEEGDYYIIFNINDDDLAPTISDVGSDALDSDITGANGPGSTSVFTLLSGQNDDTRDAGFFQCLDIIGVTYYDINEDDIRQPTENGINGLVANLYRRINGIWILWDSETTHHDYDTPSDDGIWDFCVPPGTYYMEIVMPPIGLVRVRPFVGGPDYDSDINGANGPNTTPSFTLVPGGSKTNLGAGYYPMATAGNKVWYDENTNGIQEDSEHEAQGINVQVYNMNHELVDEVLTNEDGIYKVEYLQKEEYYLKFEAPEGLTFTFANAGENEDKDSDVTHTMGINTTDPISFKPGDEIINIDAGIISGVLPLKWKEFNVAAELKRNNLSWATSLEINVDYFGIERRLENESEFVSIRTIKAVGNSTEESKYQYLDRNIDFRGIYYYRIKQVDLDGTFTYSDTKHVLRSKIESISSYPNPTTGKVTINGDFEPDELYSIQIINSVGLKVYDVSRKALDDSIEIELDKLPSGVYRLILGDGQSSIYTEKMIKL